MDVEGAVAASDAAIGLVIAETCVESLASAISIRLSPSFVYSF